MRPDGRSVLDLVAWALRADVRSDSERKIGRWHIKAALVALAMHADTDTSETFVSAARIAADIGVSERDARLLLESLEAQGLTAVDRRRKPYRRRLQIRRDASGPHTDHIRRDTSGSEVTHPQGDPQGDPQASQHLSDPIRRTAGMNDYEAAQVAKVTAYLGGDEADAIETVRQWARHRPNVQKPYAVIANMSGNQLVSELRRYQPRPTIPPCPDCDDHGWLEDANGNITGKCDHRNRPAA